MFKEHADATQEYYTARDIKIGQHLDIFNRQMFIYDADAFTKEYMLNEFGYSPDEIKPYDSRQRQIIEKASTWKDPDTLQQTTREFASKLFHKDVHGIGSEEDTIGSCLSVHPIPPKKNFVRWMKYGDMSLKFVTKFVSYRGKPVHITDVDRKFLLTFYLADSSISIYEAMGATNAGFGARFKERGPLINQPETEKQECDEYGRGRGNIYYNFEDMFIGNTIEVNGCAMQIIETDSKSKAIMEGLKAVGNDLDKFDPRLF